MNHKLSLLLLLAFSLFFLTGCKNEKLPSNSITSESDIATTSLETTESTIGSSTSHKFISSEESSSESLEMKEQYINSESAIELAKHFMIGENDLSMIEGYSFTDDNGLLYDNFSRPFFSIRVRQDAKNGFPSMAIGHIMVYADTRECFWQ